MPGSDGSVVIKIDGDDSGFQEALGNVGTIAQKAGKVAAAAVAGTGTLLTAAAAAAVNVGMSFEASMSNVAALSGATGDELQLLTDTTKEMGATTQFSATQAADALSYMALAGWDAQQSVDALPGVLDLAASSGMDLASASDMVTDYLSAFGMEAKDSTYFADLLAYAQGNADTTAAGLGEAYKNCAANMHAAGQDVETTTSLLSMLANQGLKGSEAGTALAAVMRDLTAKMEDGAIKIGDTSVKVMDANGNYRDMTDILQDVSDATNGMGDAEKAAALSSTFTSDSIKGLNMILNAGVDEAAAFEEELRNSTGTASNMADTMNDNLKGRITEMGSALEGVGIQCYEAMEGPLKRGVESATKSIGKLSDEMSNGKLRNSTEKIAEGFGKIVEKAGELTEKALPAVVNGFADVVDRGEEVVSVAGSVAAGYAAFKTTTKFILPLAKGWKAASAAAEAYTIRLLACTNAGVIFNGKLTTTQAIVGALTGKINLATAAQEAWAAITAVVNPYVALATAISAVTVGIGLYLSAQETEIEKAYEEAEAAEADRKAYEDLLTARQNSINNSMAEIDNVELLIDRFQSLTDATGRVKEGTDKYAEAKALAKQINAVAPGAIEDLDTENGKYLQVCKSVDLLIAKKRLEAMIDANQESYTEAIQKKADAEQAYADAKAAAAEARIAYEKAEEEASAHSTTSLADDYAIKAADAKEYMESLESAAKEKGTKLSEYYQTIAEQNDMIAASESDDIETVKNAMIDYESTIVEFTGKNAAACLQQMQDNNAVLANKKSNLAEGMAVTQEEINAAQSAADQQTQIAAQGINDMIQAVRSKSSDAKEAQKSINDAMLDAVGELEEPLSAESAQAVAESIMRMQVEANGAETVGQNFAEGYYEGLFSNLGIADDVAAQIVTDAIKAAKSAQDSNSPSRVMHSVGGDFADGYVEGISEKQDSAALPASALAQNAISAVQNSLVNLPIIGNLFSSLLGSGISGGAYAATGAASGVGVDAVSSAQASLSGMSNVGFSGSSLIGSGLLSNKGAATSAAQSVMTSAASSVNANTKVFSTAGKASMAAYASAIKSGGQQAVAAVQGVNKSSTAAITAQKALYTQSANVVMTAFNTGLKSRQSTITATAKTIGKAGASGVSSTKSSYQSAGYNLSLGIAAGIRSGRSSVISAAVSMAKSAIAAARSALGIHSPSTVAEKEIGQWYAKGIASGITKYAYTMQDAVDDAFYDMQDAVSAQTARVSATLAYVPNRGGTGNTSIHNEYNQTINSPKAMSRREIRRETKNIVRRINATA